MSETEIHCEMMRHKLSYGGAVNLRGEIVWKVSEEELEAMKKHIEDLFDDDEVL